MPKDINLSKKCRTCLKGSKGFQLLTKMITDKKEETKSFADFLKDITHIDIMNETFEKMPQSICGYCVRKLKAAYTFVQQAQEVHNNFYSLLSKVNNDDDNKTTNCLQEVQIDMKNYLEIKINAACDITRIDSAEHETKDQEEENISISGTNDKSKINLRKKDVKEKLTLYDGLETTTAKQIESSQFENYHHDDSDDIFDEDYSKPVELSNSDDESKCSTDSYWVKTKDNTNKLKYTDENIPTFCDQCNRVFPNSRLLRRHKSRTHVPEELKVQCPFCPAKYARRYYMYAHMRTHHKDKPIQEHITTQHRKYPRQYACEQCDGNYTSKYYLMAHIKSKHNPETAPKKTERVLLPKKRFLCALCGSKFESPSNLKVHIRRHTKEKPFKCDLCDCTFYRPCDVQVHRRSHTGEKPFTCKICGKGFAKSGKLKVHMRAHSNERPYKCDQCEKAFKDSKNLKIHKRLHTGERPYTCDVCHSGFIKSTSLKLHQTKTRHFEKPGQIVS